MTKAAILEEPQDFSLVLGGPLFQLFRRAGLSGDALELVRRRMLIISAIAWLPLLLLSAFGGQALRGGVKVSFLQDIEAQARFLIALPALIAAELIVHLRIRLVVRQFVERRIVVPEEMPKFHGAINSTMRLRNSIAVEVGLLVLVYTLGLWIWRSNVALETASWYAIPDSAQIHLTPAGYWYVFVSLPIFQFILLRWYLRFSLWFRFLWLVSRLDLRLIPMHPDRAAGLGFLGTGSYAFGPILFAQGVMLAGLIANQIFYASQQLVAFKLQIFGFLIFWVALVLSPLLVFTPHLARAKRRGLSGFGKLASRYVGAFENRWVTDEAPDDDALLGTGDIQSLADLGNSFTVIQEMRAVPFGWKDVMRLAAVAAMPLLPLMLTIFSLVDLVDHVINVLL